MKFNFHKNHKLLFATILTGFFLISLIVAVGPALNVQKSNKPLPGSAPLTESQQRGLNTYVAEGCLYCHTQQVRPLEVDEPYGRPSAPGDFARLKPQDFWRFTPSTLGTERTGPDLSNIGNRQPSEAWHYIHLYNPRAVVSKSIMQAYPWLFEIREYPIKSDLVVTLPPEYAPIKGKVIATQKAKDLVAYILSLRQTPIKGRFATLEDSTETVAKSDTGNPGKQLYGIQCASCHQANGEGVPGVFPPLVNDPVLNDPDPSEHINIIINGLKDKEINGVMYTSAMPPHRDLLSDDEIAEIVNYERQEWGNTENPVTSGDVEIIRNKK